MTLFTDMPRRFGRLDIASRAAVLSFGSNAVLMAAKLTIGLLFGSVAVLGDGVDSAEDVVASGLAFFTVRLALQPADETHPYGHGKAESLAAMSQATLIAVGAAFIVFAALRRLLAEDTEITVGPSLITMFVTVIVNLAVAAYSMRAAKLSGSVAIAADARHLLTNVVQAGGVIAGLVLVGITGSHVFDPIVALLIAAYLSWIAFGILRAASGELLDTALPAGDQVVLENVLRQEAPGVRGFHALRSRKSGRERYIDLHLLVDPALTVSDAHRRVEEIERAVHAAIPGAVVSIHLDPDEPGIMDRTPHVHDEPDPDTRLPLHRH